jgi:hypothetical protein
VQTGSNAYYSAGAGYNVVTGLGTPIASGLVNFAVTGSPSVAASVAKAASPALVTPTVSQPPGSTHKHDVVLNAPILVLPPVFFTAPAIQLVTPIVTFVPTTPAGPLNLTHAAPPGTLFGAAVNVSTAIVPPAQLAITPQAEASSSRLYWSDDPQVIAPRPWTDEPGPFDVPGGKGPIDLTPMPDDPPGLPDAVLRALESGNALCADQSADFVPLGEVATTPEAMAATGLVMMLWAWWEACSSSGETRRRRFYRI